MIGELWFLLEGNDEPVEIVPLDRANTLLPRAQEFGKVAHAGDNPANGLRALALGPGIGSIDYQCVLNRHVIRFLTLIV